MDYHDKKFDYIQKPDSQKLYAPLEDGFRAKYFPKYGFRPCMPPVLNDRAEFLADADPL